MKQRYILTIALGLILSSCNRSNDSIRTFTGNLPIVQTTSPTAAIVGQDIVTNIRLELTSLSGTVYFQQFDILMTGNKEFSISATALFQDWNTQISSPVIWTKDTMASIKTTTSGKHVLNFYNSNVLFKSDTVHVH